MCYKNTGQERKGKKMNPRLPQETSPVYNNFYRLWEEFENIDTGLRIAPIRTMARGTYPPVNISQDSKSIYVMVFSPGIELSNMNIVYQDSAMTIKGKRVVSEPDKKKGYHRNERFSGVFSRTIGLPDDLDPNQIEAKYTDGVLVVAIAKQPEIQPKQIEVKVS